MPCFVLDFFAPRGMISPDPEVADLVVEAANESEARRAGEAVAAIEALYPETFVTWVSDLLAAGEPFALGVRCVNVTHTVSRPSAMTVKEVFATARRELGTGMAELANWLSTEQNH